MRLHARVLRAGVAVMLAFTLVWAIGCSDESTKEVIKEVPVEVPQVVVTGNAAVKVGETITLAAETLFGTDTGYSWESSDDTIATVSDSGVVTGVATGEVVITATGDDTEKAGSWGVYVYDDSSMPDPIVTVTGDPAVEVGATVTLSADTLFGTDSGYGWGSDDEAIATVADGVVTGVAAGSVTITATGADTSASGSMGVYVYATGTGPAAFVSISGGFSVIVGQTLTLTAATANGTDAGYTWASGDDTIATVADGVVTGVASGEVVITATGDDTAAVGSVGIVVMAEGIEIPFEEMWAGSPHADATSEAFRHWDEDDPQEVPANCAKCHSDYGYKDFLGIDGTDAGVVDNAAAVDSVITCTTCHNAATVAMTSVTFPSGEEVTGLGAEARCIQCHQGRESTVSVNTAITDAAPADDDTVSDALGFLNVHYFAAGATLFGDQAKGAYQYDGMAYDGKFLHVDGFATCNTCHSPHTTQIKDAVCASCHGATAYEDIRMAGSKVDYDGDGDVNEGIAKEIEALHAKLWEAVQAYAANEIGTGILYDDHSYPYFFIDTNGNGQADDGEINFGNRYATWTARLLKGVYNYQFAAKDPGAFAHNAKYVIQVLYDSIMDVNAGLTTPVDTTGMTREDAGHFQGTADAWRHWDDDGEVEADCARCHSDKGLGFYLESGADVAQPLATSGMSCLTCHEDLADLSNLRDSEIVTFPSGLEVDSGDNTTNLCMNCHQGRESTISVNTAIDGLAPDTVADSLGFLNVHYFAAGATLYGTEAKGGYEYDGMFYSGRFEHATGVDTCSACHSVHQLTLKVDACAACHTGADTLETVKDIRMVGSTEDYDGDGNTDEGLYYEIDDLKTKLYAAIQAYATNTAGVDNLLYSPNAYPYFFIDTNGNGEIDDGEVNYGNRFTTWTPRLVQAAYNYQYAKKDTGGFAHNARYIIQLLHDSIMDIGGDMTGLVRNAGAHLDPTSDAWRHWDDAGSFVGEVDADCARCHSNAGAAYYWANGTDTPDPVPASYGLSCGTCHVDGTSFDRIYVASVVFPSGVQIDNDAGNPDDSFMCMTCHQGRESRATIDAAILANELGFKNVHYLSAGASIYGSAAAVGYEYDGLTYAGQFTHWGGTSAQCTACHDVNGDTHTFQPFIDGSCSGCHNEATDIHTIRKNRTTDYDNDGNNTEPLADEISALASLLYAEIQAYASATAGIDSILYDGHSYPYFFIDTNNNGVADDGEISYGNSFTTWDATLMKAAHNFQFANKETGGWAHNTDYIAQLVIDSIRDLGGDAGNALNRP